MTAVTKELRSKVKNTKIKRKLKVSPEAKVAARAKTVQMEEHKVLASLCRSSFYFFCKTFWHTVVPETPVWNWHMKYICDEVQKVAERVFKGEPKEYDLVINVPPGTSKPVWEEMKVLMGNGVYKKLKNVKVGDLVIGKSGNPCKVTAVHDQGELPTVEIKTFGGRKVVAALDHPILTVSGWVNAGDVTPDHCLAVMRDAKIKTDSNHNANEEYALAGYLIGDGCLVSGNCSFTNCDPVYLRDFLRCTKACGFGYRISKASHNQKTGVKTYSIHLKNGVGAGKIKKSGLGRGAGGFKTPGGPKAWLQSINLLGKSSKTKRVPKFVWQGTNEQIAIFLAAYFHCDGSVFKSGNSISVSMGTISKQLAKDLHRLFLRLGIALRLVKRINKKGFKYNRTLIGYEVWSLGSYDKDEVARFAAVIPLQGPKAEKLGKPGRTRFDCKYSSDKVIQVKTSGEKRCRCLTVDKDQSFVVGDIVVHNSTLISIMLPMWCWTRMPSMRFCGASYAHPLALDLARKSRDIALSDLYQKCFPEIVMRSDQASKSSFMNTKGGLRYGVGSGGSVLGMHFHIIAIDDPIDPQAVLSTAELETTNHWIERTLGQRKVDARISVTILVMQRLHQNDPTAQMLNRKNIRHIRIPATDDYAVKPSGLRKYYKQGLMDPVRLSNDVLDEKRQMGEYSFCTPGFTPILMADWREKQIEDVEVGEEVVGFDQVVQESLSSRNDKRTPDQKRGGLIKSTVLSKKIRYAPVVKLIMESGREVYCTPDHQWWNHNSAGEVASGLKRAYSRKDKVGARLWSIYTPRPKLKHDEQRLMDWLGGMFDGEGSCKHSNLHLNQSPHAHPDICKAIEYTLDTLGIEWGLYTHKKINPTMPNGRGGNIYWLNGGRGLKIHLINNCRMVKRRQVAEGLWAKPGKVSEGVDRVQKVIRLGDMKVYSLSTTSGNYVAWGYASKNCGQYGQDPVPIGGGMFKIEMLKTDTPPRTMKAYCRFWDKAGSIAEGDYTASVLMSLDFDDRVWILDVTREQIDTYRREVKMRKIAERDTKKVVVGCEQEPGSGGKQSAEETCKRLMGFKVKILVSRGDKELRAVPFSVQVNAGNVYIPHQFRAGKIWLGWAKEYVLEMEHFPFSTFDDQMDASSGAFEVLAPGKPRCGGMRRKEITTSKMGTSGLWRVG